MNNQSYYVVVKNIFELDKDLNGIESKFINET